MKVYFYSKEEGKVDQKNIHEKIIKFFKENGVIVLSNLESRPATAEQLSFENMDGLVIEGQSSVTDAGYLIALALAQRKPILYLLPKGTLFPDQLRSLQENKSLKKSFLLHYYSERTLVNFLVDFIDIIETGELRREVPTVKFTLRFTPRADRFLTWKSRQQKISKADLLRKMIDEAIKSDEEYQKHLRIPKIEKE
ncbi:hypothetical protein KKF32_01040 [Patescibacteria group bacterium]|nr:hypothetical protein [Patescibacteria group bacterium]